MKLNLDRYNNRVIDWTKKAVKSIKAEGEKLDIEHRPDSPSRGASLPKIKEGHKEEGGAIAVVSFRFRRSLIYTHKGAGKGRGGKKGSRWLDKHKNEKTTNPKSLGKAGTGGRKEKPFINNILDSEQGVDELATIAASELGDAIVSNMLIQ
jgi:hypothetical protein